MLRRLTTDVLPHESRNGKTIGTKAQLQCAGRDVRSVENGQPVVSLPLFVVAVRQ